MRELGSRPGNDRQASSPVPGGPTSEAQDSRNQGHFFKITIASPELQSETSGYRSYSRFRKHQKVQSSADTPLFLPGQRRSLYPPKRSHFSVCIGLPHLHFQLPRIFNFFLMLVSRSRQSWQIRPLELPAM